MAYTTVSGDTWDTIAKKVYGDEYCADILMKANRNHINTSVFGAGEILKTPAPKEEKNGHLPPWKYEADL